MLSISTLQSLSSHNRAAIYCLEEDAEDFKRMRKYFAEHNLIKDEYYCHKHLQLTRKKIARLVAIQKALKLEIKQKVEMASERNALNLYYTRLHAHLDSAK